MEWEWGRYLQKYLRSRCSSRGIFQIGSARAPGNNENRPWPELLSPFVRYRLASDENSFPRRRVDSMGCVAQETRLRSNTIWSTGRAARLPVLEKRLDRRRGRKLRWR